MRTPVPIPLCLIALVAFAGFARAQEQTGAQIYKEMCARCHGAKGEGTKKYEQPLTGDKSVARLAVVIDRTMPEDDPDKLDAAGSKKVAEYIYDAFYSPVAQARLNPPRVELARLTVQQYRNAVADLVGSFRAPPKLDDKRGLHAEYFNSRNFQQQGEAHRPHRPEVNFDFGTVGPEPKEDAKEKFDPHQFSIRWEGSVLAPETGDYEFVVRTDHAARLWVNDTRKPLIDAWVKSGNDTEYPRVDLPARRPRLPAAPGVLEGQAGRGRLEEEPEPAREAGVDRALMEAAAPRGRSDPLAVPHAARGRPKLRDRDALPAGRPQLRLGARHDDLEGVGPGDDRRGHRDRGIRRRATCRNWPACPTTPRTAGRSSATSPRSSPSAPSAGR